MAHSAIGPFDCLTRLGEGGTGVVYKGLHRVSGEWAAVKASRDDLPVQQELLRREIAVLGRLNRERIRGVVRVLEHGSESASPWYAMELLEGQSLQSFCTVLWDRIDRHGAPTAVQTTVTTDVDGSATSAFAKGSVGLQPQMLSASWTSESTVPAFADQPERALRVLLRLAEILARLHAHGVTHGDLSPSNVIFRDETDPVLIDFGTALADYASHDGATMPAAAPPRGTPGYIAPERLRGEHCDGRSDLYALGSIAYELATGSPAFSAELPDELFRQQLSQIQSRPSRRVRGLSPELDALILGLLEPSPLRRISHAVDVVRVLREQLKDRPAPSRRTTAVPALYPSRFHGREGVLDELLSAAARARSGAGGLFLLTAASGLGKSRLLREFARRLPHETRTFWCPASGSDGPTRRGAGLDLFAPFLLAVSHGDQSVEPSAQQARAAAALERIRAFGAARWNSIRSSSEEITASDLRDALATLLELLERESHRSPLVLVIDDVQWADELSLRFLREHAERLRSLRVMVVASRRTDTAGPELDELEQLAAARFHVQPLTSADIRSISKDMLATDTLPEGLFEFLRDQADGNPFFVAEYARAALSSRLLQRVSGAWTFDWKAASSGSIAIPASIEGLFRLRTRGLSEPAHGALQLACALDREFAAEDFRALGASAIPSRELLEELVARDILIPTRPGYYRFFHDQLREAQDRALSPAERKLHHVRIAEQLEAEPLQRLELLAGSLGRHWAAAGDPVRALPYFERAALSARQAHLLQAATHFYRLALRECELLERIGETPLRVAALRESLADVLVKQARHAEARECLSELANAWPDAQRLDRARARRKLAASYWTVHEYAAAAGALAEAERDLAEVGAEQRDAAYWVELIQMRLGHFERLYFAAKLGPELDDLTRSLQPLIREHGTDEQRCIYYFIAASHRLLQRRYAFDDQALKDAQQGLAAAASLTAQRLALAEFVVACTLMLGHVEQCAAALPHFEAALSAALALGEATLISRIRTFYAIALVRLGDPVPAQQAAQLALEAAEAARLTPYVAAARGCLGWVAWRRGEPDAIASLNAARDAWNSQQHPFPLRQFVLLPLLEFSAARDDFETAATLLRELQKSQAQPDPLSTAIERALPLLDGEDFTLANAELVTVLGVARRLRLY